MRILQILLMGGAALLIFLLFFATRDILCRTQSLLVQLCCILLVAAFPVLGFLLYLLVRPRRTLKEREMEEMVRESLALLRELPRFPDSTKASPGRQDGKIPNKSQIPILKSQLLAQGTAVPLKPAT